MRILKSRPSTTLAVRSRGLICTSALVALLAPASAFAQYGTPDFDTSAVGERYHVEIAGSLWNPSLAGQIQVSSDQWGIVGSSIDFTDDLAFETTRFKEFRAVLRPSQKSKFRLQYTPVHYTAETTLRRDITFNGQRFPLALPIASTFDWNVWRIGYEYDFLYRPRGFAGLLVEMRHTKMNATLASPLITEQTEQQAPLPALGGVGRVYVLREVAVNFEMTGFRVPEIDSNYKAHYFDWDLNTTVNVNNNVGIQVGWRQQTTFLRIKNDLGSLEFRGLWFGAALRY
jgi:hypothetical protein